MTTTPPSSPTTTTTPAKEETAAAATATTHPKKKAAKAGEDKREYVLQPRQTDVLCGRGGMSNHHAGNEWYRRLIKSNRPLYRACPKHTKLLVAKAVVQAVDQQGGRFLDKEKDTGLWYIVEYRRAVDKTSQGLRERERNGSDNDSDNDNTNNDPAINVMEGQMANPPTDLAALARQISQKDPAPGGNRPEIGAAGVYATATVIGKTLPKPVNASTFAYEYPKAHAAAVAAAWSNDNTKLPAKANNATTTTNEGDEDSQFFDPLPPTMQPRQTSMFKFLQGSKLLESEPQQQQPQYGDYDRKPAARPSVPLVDRARAQQLLHAHKKQQQRNKAGAATAESDEAAPSLTRFQSQVSDWLTSFWPVTATAAGAAGTTAATTTANDHHQSMSRKRKAALVAALPEPTELETGASQVLLQMATSSKLFRGFSSLFEDDVATNNETKKKARGATDSLLDDYEESPMDARMRHVK